jgi:hypothetical protein
MNVNIGKEVMCREVTSAKFNILYFNVCGPAGVVGIATGYELDGPGIDFPVGARFSAPVMTDPKAHPASCTMGTGSFPG